MMCDRPLVRFDRARYTDGIRYGVRQCRKHWHVMDLHSAEDIYADGVDQYATWEAAWEAAQRLNTTEGPNDA